MANVVFATANLLRASTTTLGAGPFAATTPVSNLLHREPSLPLILTDPDDAYVTIDFGADPPGIRLASVLYCNAGSWQVRADDTDPTSSPAYDSTQLVFGSGEAGLPHRRNRSHDWLWFAEKTYRYWRIDFGSPDDDDDRTIVGNIVLDYGFTPAINQVYGGNIGLIDPSRKPRAVEGQVEPLVRRPYLGVEGSLDFTTEAESFGSLLDIDEIAGTVSPVLYIRDPDATTFRQRKAVFGLYQQLTPINDAFFDVYSKPFQITELIP